MGPARVFELRLDDPFFEPVGQRLAVANELAGSRDLQLRLTMCEARKGLGCCPGIVRGPVRIVTDPKNAELHSGEILVARRTDPGWILLFPAAAGVLVEHGSLLSHSAIVAREMGIPTIVGLSDVTGWLHDGDWVELDGSSGSVRKIER